MSDMGLGFGGSQERRRVEFLWEEKTWSDTQVRQIVWLFDQHVLLGGGLVPCRSHLCTETSEKGRLT